jgi:hypothetical protein
MLDLRDLGYLLDDDKFKQGRILKNFFSGPLERFHLTVEAPVRQGSRNRPKRLDLRAIVLAVGDVITEQSPLLEALTEPTIDGVFSTALPSWVSRLSHLKRLDLFDGSALADESVCTLLHTHCPQLDSLTIYSATSEEADKHIGSFISGRRPNTLVHFENISNCHIGLDTAVALNNHGKSLTVLKLYLMGDKRQALGCLRECTSVVTLAIEYSGPPDNLKANENDLYLEVTEWLRNCTALRDISITNMVSAPDMILPILLTEAVQLHKLQINSNEGLMYLVKDHQDFHQSLGQKHSLQELSLRADPEGLIGDPLAEVTSSICSLSDLRYLHLTRISDYFSDQHVRAFAQHLVNLEHIYIGGYGISDGVWDDVARLKSLKTLTFSGLTVFTARGILRFIDQLSDGNQGLLLGIDNADADSPLTAEEQELVQDALAAKVNGSFAYQLLRGMTGKYFHTCVCTADPKQIRICQNLTLKMTPTERTPPRTSISIGRYGQPIIWFQELPPVAIGRRSSRVRLLWKPHTTFVNR